jgi:NTE family protein
VLGAGGAKGAAHVGVVRALEALGLEVSEVIGTGTGAVAGAGVAAGRGSAELLELFAELVDDDYLGQVGLKTRLQGERRAAREQGARYRAFLRRHFGALGFGELRRRFFCNALSLSTGSMRYFGLPGASRVPLVDAVYASSCLPGVFEPLELDGESYADGGMVEPLGLDLADAHRPDLIVAVDLSRRDHRRAAPAPASASDVLCRSYEIVGSVLVDHDLRDVHLRDAGDLSEVVQRGEREARHTLATHPQTRYLCDPELVKAVDRQVSEPRDYVHLDVDMAACINCGICAVTCATEGFAAVPFGNVVRKLHHYECARDAACERSCPTRAITLRHP